MTVFIYYLYDFTFAWYLQSSQQPTEDVKSRKPAWTDLDDENVRYAKKSTLGGTVNSLVRTTSTAIVTPHSSMHQTLLQC